MRQAGRYLPEYQALRSRLDFLTMCKDKAVIAEVTAMPLKRFQLDAAILFSDILLAAEPMGFALTYGDKGPTLKGRLHSAADVDRLRNVQPQESLSFVLEGVELARRTLDAKIPLIGFCAAPFTLAAYLLEGSGSKTFARTKEFLDADPGAWDALMEKLTRGLTLLLNAQIAAGVDAVQIFDTWVGCLSPSEYERYVLPHSRTLIQGVTRGVPIIHFGTGTGPFLEHFAKAQADVVGIDHQEPLNSAWGRIGHHIGIQGNLNPETLCSNPQAIRAQTEQILIEAGGRAGHIFNLGRGILPNTPLDHVSCLIETIHRFSRCKGKLACDAAAV